ncbi:GAF domain-containing protein [Sphingomonas sp. NSE70-1]|uniref:GAF domain-containing protein n=1 Tax=Sphingomonas caseinilyticus TaxID=2908205 RepID=A0ABT0RX69_9SPHN|nr:GAF domain-containing protein [Sphingomonas caseinilyticus]MCL6699618.1 GAF domain-containing protein [Sphingomonas caseinilyticus]
MPFAAALRKSLEDRDSDVSAELRRGDSLEDVLNRHLMTVEQLGGDDAFTCILLLSPDGKRLSYGAAPTVPASYCRASKSIEIGPYAGSCGAAAYYGRPIYSTDIATDPVWGNYRALALQHGYRSCWSTPIRNSNGEIIGTFAILHRSTGMPTREEIDAIDLITGHVADAIMRSRDPQFLAKRGAERMARAPLLRLVSDNLAYNDPANRLRAIAEKLQAKAVELDGYADRSDPDLLVQDLKDAAELSRKLAAAIIAQIDFISSGRRIP